MHPTLASTLSCTFAPALIALVGLAGAPAFAGDTPGSTTPPPKSESSIHQQRNPAATKGSHHHAKSHKKHKAHAKP